RAPDHESWVRSLNLFGHARFSQFPCDSTASPAADELRRGADLGALRRFTTALRRRVLTGSPPARERSLIGSPLGLGTGSLAHWKWPGCEYGMVVQRSTNVADGSLATFLIAQAKSGLTPVSDITRRAWDVSRVPKPGVSSFLSVPVQLNNRFAVCRSRSRHGPRLSTTRDSVFCAMRCGGRRRQAGATHAASDRNFSIRSAVSFGRVTMNKLPSSMISSRAFGMRCARTRPLMTGTKGSSLPMSTSVGWRNAHNHGRLVQPTMASS